MTDRSKVLVINSTFPELNHLAAALAEHDLLSCYVRPYSNLGRRWEQRIAKLPWIGRTYTRTLGRRVMPAPLTPRNVREVARTLDLALAIQQRLPIKAAWYRDLRPQLIERISGVVAKSGAACLSEQSMVVASWHCALLAFEKAKNACATTVLNYPLAHHAFTRRYLQEEAGLEPEFASTLNSHDRPQWQIDLLNREIELADRILVGSEFVKDSFVAEGVPVDKLVVIPYGVDVSLFKPADRRCRGEPFNVLFVGQLSQRKGLSYLLRAYEQFHSPRTTLTLVGQVQGDGGALMPWRYLFTHIPHVPRVELAHLFQQADVFVFPTLIEGMPLVVLEAMASGLPVIVTPNGPGGIVRDGIDGFVVPPRDVDAVADRLQQLRSNAELRISMSVNAVQRAREYGWDVYRRRAVSNLKNWVPLESTCKPTVG